MIGDRRAMVLGWRTANLDDTSWWMIEGRDSESSQSKAVG